MESPAPSDKQMAQLAVLQNVVPKVTEFVVTYFFQILGAIALLTVGWWAAGKIGGWVAALCSRRKLDAILSSFIGAAVRWGIVAFVLLSALSKFGFEIGPLIAVVGAGTLGISLALQGPISNFGAGFVIILTRPFTIGDYLSVQGVSGVVQEVKLGFTRLQTEDGEVITIPNKQIVGEIQTNSKSLRIVEASVGVAYGSDLDTAVEAVRRAVVSVDGVAAEPAPQAGLDAFADSSLNIGYRYWIPGRNYHPVRYRVNRAVHDALARARVEIPFPQRVVHLHNEKIQNPTDKS